MPALERLRSAAPPWAHLVVLKPGETAESALRVPRGFVTRTIDGRRCRTKAAFLAEAAQALAFPEDAGRNWDAFEECLADLEWLPAKGYLVIITDAGALLCESEDDYDTFVEIVEDVGREWAAPREGESARPAVPFHVCLAITQGEEPARKDWGVPLLKR